MNKSDLRSQFTGIRNQLSTHEVKASSKRIFQLLLEISELNNAKNISAYLPTQNEVDTRLIIDHLTSTGRKVFLPKYFPANTPGVKNAPEYVFAEFTGWQNLEPGPFGILQPHDIQTNTPGVSLAVSLHTPGVKKDSFDIDVAIIPGVAFDKKSTRLGYGKGVFDRLLSSFPALRVGLAYDFQIVDKLPKEAHDLTMDLIVTEKRAYSFRHPGVATTTIGS